MKVETETEVVYNLPPSLKPVPSQSVTAFRQVEPAAIPAEVAALLAIYETFLNILQQCPLDPSWPAELYRNVLSMISYCEFKWYWAYTAVPISAGRGRRRTGRFRGVL